MFTDIIMSTIAKYLLKINTLQGLCNGIYLQVFFFENLIGVHLKPTHIYTYTYMHIILIYFIVVDHEE